jgi:hypothetical protein
MSPKRSDEDELFQAKPSQREMSARAECKRRGLDPDEVCADGGIVTWMVIDVELQRHSDAREV